MFGRKKKIDLKYPIKASSLMIKFIDLNCQRTWYVMSTDVFVIGALIGEYVRHFSSLLRMAWDRPNIC